MEGRVELESGEMDGRGGASVEIEGRDVSDGEEMDGLVGLSDEMDGRAMDCAIDSRLCRIFMTRRLPLGVRRMVRLSRSGMSPLSVEYVASYFEPLRRGMMANAFFIRWLKLRLGIRPGRWGRLSMGG